MRYVSRNIGPTIIWNVCKEISINTPFNEKYFFLKEMTLEIHESSKQEVYQ